MKKRLLLLALLFSTTLFAKDFYGYKYLIFSTEKDEFTYCKTLKESWNKKEWSGTSCLMISPNLNEGKPYPVEIADFPKKYHDVHVF